MTLPDHVMPCQTLSRKGLSLLAGSRNSARVAYSRCAFGDRDGSVVLGSIKVQQGPVLYLALEDTRRRVQKRLRAILRRVGADLCPKTFTSQRPGRDKTRAG